MLCVMCILCMSLYTRCNVNWVHAYSLVGGCVSIGMIIVHYVEESVFCGLDFTF